MRKEFFTTATEHPVKRYQLAMPDSRRLHYDVINIRRKERIGEKEICRDIRYSVTLPANHMRKQEKKTMTHRVSTIRVHITNFSKLKKRKPLGSEKKKNEQSLLCIQQACCS
uniref:Uncharacterized protein n=1 Tax=Rhipicephalus zambeziensis TaxID=60191 RepID=A0A224Y7V0_9ACAR